MNCVCGGGGDRGRKGEAVESVAICQATRATLDHAASPSARARRLKDKRFSPRCSFRSLLPACRSIQPQKRASAGFVSARTMLGELPRRAVARFVPRVLTVFPNTPTRPLALQDTPNIPIFARRERAFVATGLHRGVHWRTRFYALRISCVSLSVSCWFSRKGEQLLYTQVAITAFRFLINITGFGNRVHLIFMCGIRDLWND